MLLLYSLSNKNFKHTGGSDFLYLFLTLWRSWLATLLLTVPFEQVGVKRSEKWKKETVVLTLIRAVQKQSPMRNLLCRVASFSGAKSMSINGIDKNDRKRFFQFLVYRCFWIRKLPWLTSTSTVAYAVQYDIAYTYSSTSLPKRCMHT